MASDSFLTIATHARTHTTLGFKSTAHAALHEAQNERISPTSTKSTQILSFSILGFVLWVPCAPDVT